MTCPDCGYIMSAHHTECFRCKGLEIGQWSKEKRRSQAQRQKAGGCIDEPGESKRLLTVATCTALLLYIVVRLHASSLAGNTTTVREVSPSINGPADRRPRRSLPSDVSSSSEAEAQGE
jgi:hypothetical protein